ncbi:MAG: ketoglutarate semialdehyde dehydrogenase [Anaerolineaceae bacterium]|nr:ketoglutarate semialdehyde dehydrogenase [Anaerolineaceae bacterium]
MTDQPILVNGTWQAAENPTGSFQATNPATKEPLPHSYPVSSWDDLQAMLDAAQEAVIALRQTPRSAIADFLEKYADAIEARQDALVEAANLETGLPAGTRLPGELGRTTNQLRQAGQAVRSGTWLTATIDTATNIRAMYGPLDGPVIVFGPNNFPLAFNGVSGGDMVAAIAAGNPVIAKGHPSHPRTTQLLAEAALEAIEATDVPQAMVQLFYHTSNENGTKLVAHPITGATGFTGSRTGGMALKAAADAAGKPIYLEMSSVNPIVILPGTLDERSDDMAQELFASCTLGSGQFCTNPGLVLMLDTPQTAAFIKQVESLFEGSDPGLLLNEGIIGSLKQGIQTWEQNGATRVTGGQPLQAGGYRFQNTLYTVDGATFLQHPEPLQAEAFGAASLIVLASDADQLIDCLNILEGNLTGCIYSATSDADESLYADVAAALRPKVGRLLNDKMPTGVAVSPAMMHGGPYPATGHPGFTSVGIPASIHRFAMWQSYDNIRPHRLPPELKDKNPTGTMWRFIDKTWSQADVS